MGFLTWFAKRGPAATSRLPSGSFTVDRHGNVVAETLGSEFSRRLLAEIAGEVLALFQEARAAQIPLIGVNFQYASLRVSARDLNGGAIIFLSPHKTFESNLPLSNNP
jgi:hypothetical protein